LFYTTSSASGGVTNLDVSRKLETHSKNLVRFPALKQKHRFPSHYLREVQHAHHLFVYSALFANPVKSISLTSSA